MHPPTSQASEEPAPLRIEITPGPDTARLRIAGRNGGIVEVAGHPNRLEQLATAAIRTLLTTATLVSILLPTHRFALLCLLDSCATLPT